MVPPDDTQQGQAPDTEQNVREITYEEQAVGIKFNPAGNPLVKQMKEEAAAFIDSCNELRGTSSDPEVKRMCSIAITEAQTAQMWAVKAATYTN